MPEALALVNVADPSADTLIEEDFPDQPIGIQNNPSGNIGGIEAVRKDVRAEMVDGMFSGHNLRDRRGEEDSDPIVKCQEHRDLMIGSLQRLARPVNVPCATHSEM